MAITVDASSTSTTQASGGTITANCPANAKFGDLLIAFVIGPNASPVTLPSGWISCSNSPGFGTLMARPVGGAQPSTFTFTLANSSAAAAIILLVKGLSGFYGFEAGSGTASGVAATSLVAPTITTTRVAAEMLISFYYSATAGAITVPGTQTAIAGINANTVAAVAGYETLAAVGATGTRTATASSAAWAAFNIAIVPPLAPTTGVFRNPTLGPAFTQANWWTTLGFKGPVSPRGPARPLPQWEIDPGGIEVSQRGSGVSNDGNGAFFAIDVSGTLSGTVKVQNVLTQGMMVEVLWRETGELIRRAFTDPAGAYAISGLRTGYPGYTVVYRAPSGSPVFNDIIIDRALPV